MSRALLLPIFVLLTSPAALGADWHAVHGHGRYASTPNGRLYYEVEGKGPPVLIVAGGPGDDHVRYHPTFSRLAADHTLVYFDNYGCGRSDRLPRRSDYSIARHADGIEEMRKALGYERVSLFAVSYGTLPALEYTIRHPERVARLVITDGQATAAQWQANIDRGNQILRSQYPETWQKIQALRERGVKSSAPEYQALMGVLEGPMFWLDRLGHPELAKSDDPADRFNPEVYYGIVGDDPEWVVGGTMKGYDPTAAMAKLATPTLIVVGRFDLVATPEVANQIHAALPSSKVVVLERSGHRPWIEDATAYFDLVGAFLRGGD